MILVMIMMIATKTFFCLSCLSKSWKFRKFVTYSRYGRETSLTKCPPETWTYSVRWRVATPWSRGDFEFFQTSPLTQPVWMELFESYLDFGENIISTYIIYNIWYITYVHEFNLQLTRLAELLYDTGTWMESDKTFSRHSIWFGHACMLVSRCV